MCGICGVFETGRARVSRETLRRMTDSLAHRGPDAEGYFLAEHGGAASPDLPDAPVALGHRRLKIIDLSDSANQPMLFEDGRLAVVFNGEIFNFRQLITEFFSDRQPLTNSDTEVIGWAYRKWGLDCFKYFNGFFALAIYDADRDLLVLARDRMGKKPLFYYQHEGHLVFGSELKALCEYPRLVRALDRRALLEYLIFLYVPGEGCILQHCHKLAAGSYLTINGKGETHGERYYDVLGEPAHLEPIKLPDEEYEKILDKLLLDATRLRLISDVPLGAFLSGGIDSSTIVSYMCRASTARPRTFTIAYEDKKFNEGPFAAAVAKHLETEHTELVVQPDDALALFEHLPRIYDEPFADPSALPTTLLSELTRRHVTVALSGDGGDELFFGYDRYKRALEFARWLWIPHLLRAPVGGLLSRFGNRGLKLGRRVEQPDFASYFLLRSSVFNEYDLPQLTGRTFPADNELARVLKQLNDVPLHRRMRAAEARLYLCDDILQKVDRASMSCALETRAPLLDYRVVEFALGLPQNMLLRGRTRKYLLKRLLFNFVPEKIFRRPKMGFRIPLGAWFRGKLRPMLDHYLEPERLRRQGLLQPPFVSKLVEDHMTEKHDAAHALFSLLVFQMWYDAYLK